MDLAQQRSLAVVAPYMKVRRLEFWFGLGLCGVGAVVGISEEEICHNKCWLDVASDFVLPVAFQSYSGALPFVLIGLIFICASFRKM